MTWLAQVTEDRHGDTPVAAVEGEIDGANVGEIAERVRAMLTNQSTALVVDLARTRYITELQSRQQRLVLVVDPASNIARMLAITGLDAAVPIHPTRAAALADAI